jgi:hypothetical protein
MKFRQIDDLQFARRIDIVAVSERGRHHEIFRARDMTVLEVQPSAPARRAHRDVHRRC